MPKIRTMRTSRKNILQGQLTVGVDLGDRSSAYCVLIEAGEIVLEHKLATTPQAMKQAFGSMPRCRIATETGTHSPWMSRLLTTLGHEVTVGHALKVRLITKSRRKDSAWLDGKNERNDGKARKTIDSDRPSHGRT
jgi:transposase